MTTTRTRSRGRRDSRSSAIREGAERRPVILVSAVTVIVLLAFGLAVTSAGHVVLAASQHFLLKYSGVFALLALTGSVCMGVIAADRIVMTPGHRVLAQAVHRAVSFGALAFLIIHIVLEITARHLEESPTQHVHLLDAFIPFLSQYRTFYMAEGTIASDLIVLLVVTGIVRRRFTASGHAWKWRAIHYSSYAALILGVLHGLLAGRQAIGSFVYWSYGIVIALVALAVLVRILASSLRSRDAVLAASPQSDPSKAAGQSMPARAAALGLMGQLTGAMPLAGAPGAGAAALTGALPALDPFPPVTSAAPRALAAPGAGPQPPYGTGPIPRLGTGPMPYAGTGPMPQAGTGPMPYAGTGPIPHAGTGPMPQAGTGPIPYAGTGQVPHAGTGPIPYAGTGPSPRVATGPQPGPRTGPMPRVGTGPQPVSPERPEGFRPRPPAGPPPGYGLDPREAAYRADPRYQRPEPRPGYGPGPAPAPYGTSDPYGAAVPYGADAPYGARAPYEVSDPYGASAPYQRGAPYQGGAPYPGTPYQASAPYDHRPPYDQGRPYDQGAPYEQRAPYDHRAYEPGPQGGYDPDQGYGAPPPQPMDGYPAGYAAAPPPGGAPAYPQPGQPQPGQYQPGRRRRPGGPEAQDNTGPVPPVPTYGGEERR